MAVFRVEKNHDYTVMSNYHLKDKGLSLKAKGLLSMILSLPEGWNYTTRGLAAICKEGVDSIGGALRELEQAGYLVRNRLRSGNGRITDTEYVIFEKPRNKPDQAEPNTAVPCTENPYMDDPDTEKPAQLNTYGSSTHLSNTDEANTHQSNPDRIHTGRPAPAACRMENDRMDEQEYRRTRLEVEEQIDYDALDTPGNHERLEEIVNLITDTLCTRKTHIRISGENFPVEVVKGRFRKLNMYHIEYVFASLDKKRTEVRNIRQYLMTTLYNAPATMSNYFDAEVRSLGIL